MYLTILTHIKKIHNVTMQILCSTPVN